MIVFCVIQNQHRSSKRFASRLSTANSAGFFKDAYTVIDSLPSSSSLLVTLLLCIYLQFGFTIDSCKTLTYDIIQLMNPNAIIDNMLNASHIENLDEQAEALCLSMIDRGLAPRIDQIQFFVDHFSISSSKTKQILIDNFIALIAILAYDDVSTNQERQRELVLFQLISVMMLEHIRLFHALHLVLLQLLSYV